MSCRDSTEGILYKSVTSCVTHTWLSQQKIHTVHYICWVFRPGYRANRKKKREEWVWGEGGVEGGFMCWFINKG